MDWNGVKDKSVWLVGSDRCLRIACACHWAEMHVSCMPKHVRLDGKTVLWHWRGWSNVVGQATGQVADLASPSRE